jgi:hypothetical protein
MWLINTASLVLEFVEDPGTCVYAILSHRWGDGEISFQDMINIERARKKLGFSKIERTCQLARNRNIEYAWVGKLYLRHILILPLERKFLEFKGP